MLDALTLSATVMWAEGSETTPSTVGGWSLVRVAFLDLSDFSLCQLNLQRLETLLGHEEASLMGYLFCLEDSILNLCEFWWLFPDSGGHARTRNGSISEAETSTDPSVPDQCSYYG